MGCPLHTDYILRTEATQMKVFLQHKQFRLVWVKLETQGAKITVYKNSVYDSYFNQVYGYSNIINFYGIPVTK